MTLTYEPTVTQIAALLLLVRTIVRIVAFTGGLGSPLLQSQLISLLLDDTLVLLACAVLTIVPPGRAFGTACWDATTPLIVHKNDKDRLRPRHPSTRYVPLRKWPKGILQWAKKQEGDEEIGGCRGQQQRKVHKTTAKQSAVTSSPRSVPSVSASIKEASPRFYRMTTGAPPLRSRSPVPPVPPLITTAAVAQLTSPSEQSQRVYQRPPYDLSPEHSVPFMEPGSPPISLDSREGGGLVSPAESSTIGGHSLRPWVSSSREISALSLVNPDRIWN